MTDYKTIYEEKKEEFLKDYFTFLKFPSISTDPQYKNDVNNCCDWVIDYLKKIGLKVEKWKTKGHPTIFATHFEDEKYETLLLYCHYDVQPVDPLDLWKSPPFEPIIREGQVFARGAVDNKGQCFYTLAALKVLLEKKKKLNLNLKLVFEGEEESGSVGLHGILQEKKNELKADHILIVDSGIEAKDEPAITLGARGLVTFTVVLQGSNFDLHSGTHGGIVYNTNRAMVELLASLHDENGKVTVEHFYDDVKPFSDKEKQELNLSFDEEHLKTHFGALAIGGEKGYTPLESAWLRPTLEINGIAGGYYGPGFKTVIPALATAKISCRLVPHQKPEKMGELVKKHLLKHVPNGMQITVDVMEGKGEAFRANPQSKIAAVMAEAYSDVFQKPCGKIMIGGSIPIAAELAKVSGGEMLLVGLCLHDDLIHAPNEHFGLDRFEQGFLSICRGIELLSIKNI